MYLPSEYCGAPLTLTITNITAKYIFIIKYVIETNYQSNSTLIGQVISFAVVVEISTGKKYKGGQHQTRDTQAGSWKFYHVVFEKITSCLVNII